MNHPSPKRPKVTRKHIEAALAALEQAETILRLLYLDEQHAGCVTREVAQHSGVVALRCLEHARRVLGERRGEARASNGLRS